MRKLLVLALVLLCLPLIVLLRSVNFDALPGKNEVEDSPVVRLTPKNIQHTTSKNNGRPSSSSGNKVVSIVSQQVLDHLADHTMPLDVAEARNLIKRQQKEQKEEKAAAGGEGVVGEGRPLQNFNPEIISNGTEMLRKKIVTPAKCSGLRCSWSFFKYTEEEKCVELQKLTNAEIQRYPEWRRKIGPISIPNKGRSFAQAPDPYPPAERKALFQERTRLLEEHPQARAFLKKFGKYKEETGVKNAEFVFKLARSIVLGRLIPDAPDLVPAIVTPLLFDGKEVKHLMNTFEPVPLLNFIFVWNSQDEDIRKVVNQLAQFPFGVHVINNGHNVGFSASMNMGMLKAIELNHLEAESIMGKQSSVQLVDEDTSSDLPDSSAALTQQEQDPTLFDTVTAAFYNSLTTHQKANFPYEPTWFFLLNADTAFDPGTLGRFAYHCNDLSPKGYGIFYGHEQEHYAFAVSLIAIRSAGLMDEAIFPAYMEDVDWHWRIRLCGLGQVLTGGRIQHIRSVNLRYARSKEAQSFHAMHGRSGNNFAYGKAKWGYYAQSNIYDDRPPSGVGRPFNIPSAPLSLWMVDESHRRCFTTGQGHRNIEGHCWFNGTNLLDYFTHLAMRQIHKRGKLGLAPVEGRSDVRLKELLPSVVMDPRGNLNEPHKRPQIGIEFFIQGVQSHVLDKNPSNRADFFARKKILADYPWHTAP